MGGIKTAGDVTHSNLQCESDMKEGHGWQGAQQRRGREVGKDTGCSRDGQLSEVAWLGAEITDASRVRPVFSMQEVNT